MHAGFIVRTAALAVLLACAMRLQLAFMHAGHILGSPWHVVKHLCRQLSGVSSCADYAFVPEQEAQDIFGDADELLEDFRARARPGQQEPLDEDEDPDAEDLGDDDEARADRLRAIVSFACPLC